MILKQDFPASLESCKGFNTEQFVGSHQIAPPVSIRVNPFKFQKKIQAPLASHAKALCLEALSKEQEIPWCSGGYYLHERPVFTLDPLLHAGGYYVQEASSMFIDHALRLILKDRDNLKGLDLCAAPGGKTTLLSSISNFNLLLANEIIQSRVPVLYENIVKWGNDRVYVSNNDPREIGKLEGFFDVILVNAPCSGSGLFRKDEAAMDHWDKSLVEFCSVRQQRILEDIYPALAENGILAYSTCSYSFEENEANLDFLMSKFDLESVQIPFPENWGVVETQSPEKQAYGYRFYPNKVKGEGFFCSFFVKKAVTHFVDISNKRSRSLYTSSHLKFFLQNPDEHICFLHEKDVFAVKESCFESFQVLHSSLNLKKSGLRLGSVVRDELLPDHELAMSTSQNKALPAIDIDLRSALKYLRKLDMGIDVDQKGWVLVKFQGLPLGWVKSIPRRMNNYYPMNWRILMRE